MLGHMVSRVLAGDHQVTGSTSRPQTDAARTSQKLDGVVVVTDVDVREFRSVITVLESIQPDVVINCVGIVKQRMDASSTLAALEVNGVFPHRLAQYCSERAIRVVHFSTDCVFEGTPGIKHLTDTPNATDVYGMTKRLGEVDYGTALTLRTSIVGRQLDGKESLFEWVIGQRGGTIHGYLNALYSGVTTRTAANIVKQIIENHPSLRGLYQVASAPISKFDLISELNRRLGLNLTIVPERDFRCDRRLDGSKFANDTGIKVPSWSEMLDEFCADQGFYS